MKAKAEVADVLDANWPQVEQSATINSWQLRTLSAVRRCRTAGLGSHVDGCTSCGHLRISYNSCRNRHCPKCQGKERDKWIQAREAELLPVPYFHVVFTLPDILNQMCLHEPATMYNILFDSVWNTINCFGQDAKWLGAGTGMIAILHTWGQTMTLHPHLHCIVPGGGLTKQNKWKRAKSEGKYLFNVKAMSSVFRGKFMAQLKKRLPGHLTPALTNSLYKQQWVVFAKKPFDSPHSVIEYLGRYTHKIAISNHRLQKQENGKVDFTYKDYKQGAATKTMQLDGMEFIRRFSLHILPKGFVRIRHYGILSSSSKKRKAEIIKAQLPAIKIPPYIKPKVKKEPFNVRQCPCCKKETMQTILQFKNKPPPVYWPQLATDLLQCMV
jgi:Putative transposase/Transposase zinc-binding domain